MNGFDWTYKYPDIQRICSLFGYEEIKNATRFSYNSFPSIIQDGPQCGLVTVAMLLEQPCKETVDKLLSQAKELNYTYNGELFSARDMCDIVKKNLPNKEIELYDGYFATTKVKEFLLEGGFALVPYDSDKNHSPCLQQGHKAHWALVAGAVEVPNDFLVLTKQGKSKNLAVWRIENLAESNSQLINFSPDRKMSNVEYKLPDGGISGPLGLKSKAVLIK